MTRVAIIGAGPYGLSIAAHLRSLGVGHYVFGRPLETRRRQMPDGMMLKSDGFASNLSAPGDEGTLAAYCASRGIPYQDTHVPVSLELFVEYALDFRQRFVPDLDDRLVATRRDRDRRRIVRHRPRDAPPRSRGEHAAGRPNQQASLLVPTRARTTQPVATRQAPSSGLGPGLRSWLFQNAPSLYRFLPGKLRLTIARRHLGPQAAWLMRERFESGVRTTLGAEIESARAGDGRVRLVLRMADGEHAEVATDHVVVATGYWPHVDRPEFLAEPLPSFLDAHATMPVVSRSFETSIPGLYGVGPPSLNSFGPLMRARGNRHGGVPRGARSRADLLRGRPRIRAERPRRRRAGDRPPTMTAAARHLVARYRLS